MEAALPIKVYNEDELSKIVYEAALRVHKKLGPGLLERSYVVCLAHEIRKHGLKVEVEKELPLMYEEIYLEVGYRIDILVDDKLIIEVKAVEALNDVHMAQILTYLKLSEKKLGLLINFNAALLKKGVKRVINGKL